MHVTALRVNLGNPTADSDTTWKWKSPDELLLDVHASLTFVMLVASVRDGKSHPT